MKKVKVNFLLAVYVFAHHVNTIRFACILSVLKDSGNGFKDQISLLLRKIITHSNIFLNNFLIVSLSDLVFCYLHKTFVFIFNPYCIFSDGELVFNCIFNVVCYLIFVALIFIQNFQTMLYIQSKSNKQLRCGIKWKVLFYYSFVKRKYHKTIMIE